MKTILLARHAEYTYDPASIDQVATPLNPIGQARAIALANVLARAGVSAIFTSEAARTQQTAQPLATRLNRPAEVVSAFAPDQLLARVLAADSGPVVLVVGHTDTIPDFVTMLGVSGEPPEIDRHEDLFVVHFIGPGHATLVRLRYGMVS